MASRALQINLGIRGLTPTRRGLQQVAQDADKASNAADKLTASLAALGKQIASLGTQRLNLNLGGGGSLPVASGGGYRGSGGGSLARWKAASAAVKADPTDFDAQVRLARAENSFQRDKELLRPKTGIDKLNSFFLSSRFGMGGAGGGGGLQLFPLVNRTLPLLGMGLSKLIGPLGLVYTGLSMFSRVASESAATLRSYANARLTSGGTPGEVAGLTGLGLPADQLAEHAAAFRRNISIEQMTGQQRASAAGLGIKPALNRFYGTQDEAGLLLDAIDKLHANRGNPNQLRYANELGLTPFLGIANRSDATYQRGRQDLMRRSQDMAGTDQLSRDVEGSKASLQADMQKYGAGAGKFWLNATRLWNVQWGHVFRGEGRQFFDAIAGKDPLLKSEGAAGAGGDTMKDLQKKTNSGIDRLIQVVEAGTGGLGAKGQRAVRLSGPSLQEAIRAGAFNHRMWNYSTRS